jgi:hypothetical protein
VVDGNSRFAKHNIYKSDVFSIGLMFYQLASMEDVTGFNQKTAEYDGEKLIEAGIRRLKQRYGELMCETIKLMLRFFETDRPSFIELSNIVLVTIPDVSTLSEKERESLIQSPNSGKTMLPKINPNANGSKLGQQSTSHQP